MQRKSYRLDRSGLDTLIQVLKNRGYHTYGPRIRDQAIQWLPVRSAGELPAGWTNESGPGA